MITLLREVYNVFNENLFDNSLPDVDFVVNVHRKHSLHFRPPAIIEIGEDCARLEKILLLDDLLHSMVHVHNHAQGVEDVTRNQYHKIEFCNEALRVGLHVMCHPARGWGITSSDPAVFAEDSKIRNPDQDASRILTRILRQIEWDEDKQTTCQQKMLLEIDRRPHKQFQFKYVCGCKPPFIVRVGRRPDGERPLHAKCLRCNVKFVFEPN